MTDKQIIIDDVDVVKCKYYNNGWCLLSESCDQIKYRSCGNMTLFDCHYRNWQRKEQECEKLKVCLFQVQNASISLTKQLDQLKADNKHLNDLLNQALKELEQSREAIEKIKGICEFDFTMSKTNLLAKSILQICDEVNDAN